MKYNKWGIIAKNNKWTNFWYTYYTGKNTYNWDIYDFRNSHEPVFMKILHILKFLPKIIHLNQDYSLTEHRMTTNVVWWQSTINKLSNDIQHNRNILVIEFEYAYLHFDKIYGFCMVALATSYFSGLRTFYLPTAIFLSLILLGRQPRAFYSTQRDTNIWPQKVLEINIVVLWLLIVTGVNTLWALLACIHAGWLLVHVHVHVHVHLFSTYKNNQNIQQYKQFIHKTFLVEGNSNRSLTFRGWTPGQIKCIIKFKIIQ